MIASPFVANASGPQNDAGTGRDAPDGTTGGPYPMLGTGSYEGTLDPSNGDRGDVYLVATNVSGSFHCLAGNATVHVEGVGVEVRVDGNWGAILDTPADFRFSPGCGGFRVEAVNDSDARILAYSMVIVTPSPPPLPDFRVVSIEVRQAPQGRPSDLVATSTVHVVADNIGTAGGSVALDVWISGHAKGVYTSDYLASDFIHLSPGENKSFDIPWNSTGDVGNITLTAGLFGGCCDDMWDLNESNNVMTTSYAVLAALPNGDGIVTTEVTSTASSIAQGVICAKTGHVVC